MFTYRMKNSSPKMTQVNWDNSIRNRSKQLEFASEHGASAQHIDIIDVTNGRILQIPMARPAGPGTTQKMSKKWEMFLPR